MSVSPKPGTPPTPRLQRELQVQPCGEWCRYFARPFGDHRHHYGSCTHTRLAHRHQPIRPGRDCLHFEPHEA